ncbi:Hypothetical predicted protein [Mytilus galloprovincialis]|uniref:Uncharacterized protein n=1 Tax=Mytilus galloprovincialis TaxID=29158 RepID=A0A8B6FKL7_MYTGA|nr:Hypothetical predicted protein [Mytilus galloprovincialis]
MNLEFAYLYRWVLVFSWISGFQTAEIQNKYVSTGTDVMIKCPNNNVNAWRKCKSKDILANCDKGNTLINPSLNISDRISVTEDCQLIIQKFTTGDLGTYLCVETDFKNKNYIINVQLRNIKILESDRANIVRVTEGTVLNLTCTVLGGLSGDSVYWTKGNELLTFDNASYLSLTLQANRSFNMKEFVCMANNSNGLNPIEARVRLHLILKPLVSIIVFQNSSERKNQKSVQVRQGHYLQLKCQDNFEENEDLEMTWLFNGMLLQNKSNKVVIEQIHPERSGEYTCTVKNKAGTDYAAVNITVTYFPIVRCENVTFHDRDRQRTLECKVSGEPNTYNISWFHFSYHNQLVRMFKNINDKMLTLPIGDSNDLWYEDSGIYTCNVTNGIPDDSGNLWQTGKIVVVIEGIPVLVKPRKYEYIGHFNETSRLSIYVLSSSKIVKVVWFDERQNHPPTSKCVPTVTKVEAFEQLINETSYKCEYVIKNTTEDDFQNYTVFITNQCGQNAFNISLVSARVPDEPTNIRLRSTTNQILVKFKPGFHGGSEQNILIEYRKASAGTWISRGIKNHCTHYVIQNLKPSTEYELRMYAINKLGNSTVTEIYRKFTKDETNGSSTKYLSFAIGFVVLAGLFVTWLRFRKGLVQTNSKYKHRLVEKTYIRRLRDAGKI